MNICCCKPILHGPIFEANTVTVVWEGHGQLQATDTLSEVTEWRNIDTPVEMDPETGEFRTTFPRPRGSLFFRIVGSDETIGCAECGDDGGSSVEP